MNNGKTGKSMVLTSEVFHVKASPVDPNRIYAAQALEWFGQVIHRSDDGGKSWEKVGS